MSKMPTLLLSGSLDRVKVAVPGLSLGLSPLQMYTSSLYLKLASLYALSLM